MYSRTLKLAKPPYSLATREELSGSQFCQELCSEHALTCTINIRHYLNGLITGMFQVEIPLAGGYAGQLKHMTRSCSEILVCWLVKKGGGGGVPTFVIKAAVLGLIVAFPLG